MIDHALHAPLQLMFASVCCCVTDWVPLGSDIRLCGCLLRAATFSESTFAAAGVRIMLSHMAILRIRFHDPAHVQDILYSIPRISPSSPHSQSWHIYEQQFYRTRLKKPFLGCT